MESELRVGENVLWGLLPPDLESATNYSPPLHIWLLPKNSLEQESKSLRKKTGEGCTLCCSSQELRPRRCLEIQRRIPAPNKPQSGDGYRILRAVMMTTMTFGLIFYELCPLHTPRSSQTTNAQPSRCPALSSLPFNLTLLQIPLSSLPAAVQNQELLVTPHLQPRAGWVSNLDSSRSELCSKRYVECLC